MATENVIAPLLEQAQQEYNRVVRMRATPKHVVSEKAAPLPCQLPQTRAISTTLCRQVISTHGCGFLLLVVFYCAG
jgi:hypothetical protein